MNVGMISIQYSVAVGFERILRDIENILLLKCLWRENLP